MSTHLDLQLLAGSVRFIALQNYLQSLSWLYIMLVTQANYNATRKTVRSADQALRTLIKALPLAPNTAPVCIEKQTEICANFENMLSLLAQTPLLNKESLLIYRAAAEAHAHCHSQIAIRSKPERLPNFASAICWYRYQKYRRQKRSQINNPAPAFKTRRDNINHLDWHAESLPRRINGLILSQLILEQQRLTQAVLA